MSNQFLYWPQKYTFHPEQKIKCKFFTIKCGFGSHSFQFQATKINFAYFKLTFIFLSKLLLSYSFKFNIRPNVSPANSNTQPCMFYMVWSPLSSETGSVRKSWPAATSLIILHQILAQQFILILILPECDVTSNNNLTRM